MPTESYATKKPNLEERIKQFNQAALHRELTSATIIKKAFEEVLDFQAKPNLKERIMGAVDETLHDMISAEDHETYHLHVTRLEALLHGLQQYLALEDESDSARKYLLARKMAKTLEPLNFTNNDQIAELAARMKEEHLDEPLETQLNQLASATDETFQNLKKNLLENLSKIEQPSDDLISLALVKQNIALLTHTRETYLKKTNSRGRMLKNLAWIGLGGLLTAAAAVGSFIFPPLSIAGVLTGVAAIGYGASDLIKQGRELKEQRNQNKLGSRHIDEETEQEIKKLAGNLNFNIDEFLTARKEHHQQLAQENKKTG